MIARLIRRLWLHQRLRWLRADIRHLEADIAHAMRQQPRLDYWRREEAALVCELAQIPPRDWRSIVFASSLGAALAVLLAYGPSLMTRA